MVRVSALRKPLRCVPPSTVLMLLAKLNSVLGVAVVVLQRDFHGERVAVRQLALALEVDRLLVQHRFAAVQVLDEFGDAAAVVKLVLLDGSSRSSVSVIFRPCSETPVRAAAGPGCRN